ncbi:MAG: phosphotransferase [Microcystaceae cyanobacterium]
MQLLSPFTTHSQQTLPLESEHSGEMFPVIYSILSPHALVSVLQTHYPIGAVKQCQFWHRGLSDTYLVNIDDQAYILRVSHHHWRSQNDIGFELELLDFLHQYNLPVAYPIKTNNDKLFIEITAPEGKRYLTLFTYALGTVAIGDINVTQARLLGETVANIHCASQGFNSLFKRQPLTLDYLLDDSLAVIVPFLQPRQQDLEELLEIANDIKTVLAKLPIQSPYWSVCWGDPHSGNVHFTTDNQLTLFDFDQCGYGWRMFDMAKFLQVSMQGGLSRRVQEAFFQGYETIESFTALEKECLQTLTQTAYIWSWAISLTATQFYDYCQLDSGYFRQRVQQLKRFTSRDWLLF